MPFRLLGLAEDPSHLVELSGKTFSNYAAAGVAVSVAVVDGLELERAVIDAIAEAQPHVIVALPGPPAFSEAVMTAFKRAPQQQGRGPASKLYFRVRPPLTPSVTTVVSSPGQREPELFIRVFPQPWVSGIVERDLFAGVRQSPAPSLPELLAA